MGQVLHGSATTTAAVRRAIQYSQESLNRVAERYDINPKTVAKWKKRTHVDDAPMGPKKPRSTVLTPEQEAACVAFRKHTLLPLDDCLYALQHGIPALMRSSLHRLFQRHDISRLPEMDGEKPAKKKFKKYPIGYFHIDIAEVRTERRFSRSARQSHADHAADGSGRSSREGSRSDRSAPRATPTPAFPLGSPRRTAGRGREVRLTQVLNNLLTNAALYTPQGGRVAVTGVREGDEVVLRIRDSGIGIDPALLPNIFEMFEQGARSADRGHMADLDSGSLWRVHSPCSRRRGDGNE